MSSTAPATAAGGAAGGDARAAAGATALPASAGPSADVAEMTAHVGLARHQNARHVQMDDGERGWLQLRSPDRKKACPQYFSSISVCAVPTRGESKVILTQF